MDEIYEFDVFISHASEDTDAIAMPLAEALSKCGQKVWIDKMQLHLGDSLRRKIDLGLSKSRYGIVILSKHFFAKEWTQKELDALVSREDGKTKVILPVWHEVSKESVTNFSPTLSDKFAVSTSNSLDKIVEEILKVIIPDVPNRLKRLNQLAHIRDEGYYWTNDGGYGTVDVTEYDKKFEKDKKCMKCNSLGLYHWETHSYGVDFNDVTTYITGHYDYCNHCGYLESHSDYSEER